MAGSGEVVKPDVFEIQREFGSDEEAFVDFLVADIERMKAEIDAAKMEE